MTKFDLLAIISVLTNKSERLVLIMRKNGLTTAGMIVILSAAGVLAITSLIALATAKMRYLGHNYSINYNAQEDLNAIRAIMGGIMAFALLSFIWAFSKKKGSLILGIVIAAIAAFYCTGLFIAALATGPVEVSPVLLGFMAFSSIALLVGIILKLVGINKMNKQLSQ